MSRNSLLREDETRSPIEPIISDEAQPRPLEDSSILVGPVDADERRQETRRGGEEDHATSRSKEARRDSSAVVCIRQVVEGTREDDRVERSDLEGRTREVGPEQIAAVSGSRQHFTREIDADRGRELSRGEAGADADVQDSRPADLRSNPVQPLAFVDSRVDPIVPRGDSVEEPPGLRGPLDDGHDLRTAPSHLKSRAVPAKSISRGDRWRGTHGEGGGQARGGTHSDEVLEGVFGSCAAVPSGRR